MSNWGTSAVTNMQGTFAYASVFNRPLAWDTSKVTNMKGTFYDARLFNQPLAWDTSKVTTIKRSTRRNGLQLIRSPGTRAR